jgi:hypothetical protein
MNKILVCFSAAILLLSCKKSADDPTTTEILVGAKWGLSKLTLESPLGNPPVDITLTTFKPCELDDIFEFKQDGSYTASENTDVCVGSNNSVLYSLNGGNWSLSSGDSVLTIQKGLISQSFRFSKKTYNLIQIYQQQKNYLDQLVRYTYVLQVVK